MNNQDRQNLSEEKLKELQRKEALSTSDEYDIQDQTYDSAPITRQYVKDDVVAKGAQFIIDDEDDDPFASERHGDVIMDDDEEDVIVINPPQKEDPPEEEDVNAKYMKKSVDELRKAPGFERTQTEALSTEVISSNPTPARKTAKENDRDYIDRGITVKHKDTESFEQLEKQPKVKKQKNMFWLKPVLSITAIILSIILAILLFFFIKDFNGASQQPSAQKNEYVMFVNETNKILTVENSTCKEFKNITEQFIIDAVTAEEYVNKVTQLRAELNTEFQNYYSLSISNNLDVYDIKSLTYDYIKIVLNSMDSVINTKDKSSTEIKQLVLSTTSDQLASRENQFTNILALINENAKKYDIESEIQNNTIYFNVKVNN